MKCEMTMYRITELDNGKELSDLILTRNLIDIFHRVSFLHYLFVIGSKL